jgi:hypothetical protein
MWKSETAGVEGNKIKPRMSRSQKQVDQEGQRHRRWVHATEEIEGEPSEGENEGKVRTSNAEEIQRRRNARTRNEAEDVKSKLKLNEGDQVCETES